MANQTSPLMTPEEISEMLAPPVITEEPNVIDESLAQVRRNNEEFSRELESLGRGKEKVDRQSLRYDPSKSNRKDECWMNSWMSKNDSLHRLKPIKVTITPNDLSEVKEYVLAMTKNGFWETDVIEIMLLLGKGCHSYKVGLTFKRLEEEGFFKFIQYKKYGCSVVKRYQLL